MIKVICSKCGKDITEHKTARHVEVRADTILTIQDLSSGLYLPKIKEWDLCKGCLGKLKKFVEKEK